MARAGVHMTRCCRAVHVQHAEHMEPLAVAKVLQALCLKEQPNLVLVGEHNMPRRHSLTVCGRWASRRSTTTPARQAVCWLRY
jgi:hypothetical protein